MSNGNLLAFGMGISFVVLAASYVIARGRVLFPVVRLRAPILKRTGSPVADVISVAPGQS